MEGGPHVGIAYDLRPVAGHESLVAQVVKAFGRLDVLVQTAAVLVRRPSVFDVSEADWDFQHDINLKASFFLAQARRGLMRNRARAAGSSISPRRAGRAAGSAARSPMPQQRVASFR